MTDLLARRGRRRRTTAAVQEALFEVQVRPERRFYRQMLDALARSGFGADVLEAELVTSRLFGTVWASQEGPRDGSTEEAFGLGFVEYARHRRLPVSVAALRTVARVAPIMQVRDAAAAAVDALVADGLPAPVWPALLPGACWAYEDVFGDGATLVCEFAYGAEAAAAVPHAVLTYVDHAMFSVATDAMLVADADPLIRDMRNETHIGDATLRQVDPAWARALLERAFARTDLIDGVRTEPTFAELRALVLARLTALPDDPASLPAEPPEPTPEQREAIVEQFLASGLALASGDPAAVAAVARSIVEYAGRYEPDRLLRVSPAKWERFTFDWLPGQAFGSGVLELVPDVMRAWTTWAGRTLPDTARAELAASVEEILADRARSAGG